MIELSVSNKPINTDLLSFVLSIDFTYQSIWIHIYKQLNDEYIFLPSSTSLHGAPEWSKQW